MGQIVAAYWNELGMFIGKPPLCGLFYFHFPSFMLYPMARRFSCISLWVRCTSNIFILIIDSKQCACIEHNLSKRVTTKNRKLLHIRLDIDLLDHQSYNEHKHKFYFVFILLVYMYTVRGLLIWNVKYIRLHLKITQSELHIKKQINRGSSTWTDKSTPPPTNHPHCPLWVIHNQWPYSGLSM